MTRPLSRVQRALPSVPGARHREGSAPSGHRPAFTLALCLVLSLGSLACSVDVPVLLPPPFGPGKPQPPRLFFPTGMVVARSGHLLVANANFDHAYDSGALVSLDPAWLASVFSSTNPLVRDEQIPSSAFTSAALIGSYAGPLVLDDAAFGGQNAVQTAYTGSRDSNILAGVQVDAAGMLSCRGTGGTDCRTGVINLGLADNLESPYGIAAGFSHPPGAAQDLPTIFVSALSPHIDQINSGTAYTSAPVAALDATNPGSILYSVLASLNNGVVNVAGGIGAGPIVFDGARRNLILGGCYQRFPNSTQGNPSTGKCVPGTVPNQLRILSVDSGSDSSVRIVDLSATVRGSEVNWMTLGPEDANGRAHTLYATVRNPDVLVEIELPDDPGTLPFVTRATSLPSAPGQIVRILRPAGAPPGGELLGITGATSGTVDLFDVAAGQVVSRIERLGEVPYSIVQLPPAPGDTNAHLVAAVFGDCRLGLIEVSYAQPWQTRLRARMGTCPP